MRVRIMDRIWSLGYHHQITKDWGWCDPPNTKNKKIGINAKVRSIIELDTIIHECTHAACFVLSEDIVTESATYLAGVLWSLGYRKRPKKEGTKKELISLQDLCIFHLRVNFGYLKEEFVIEFAQDLSKILWRLGYKI